MLKLVPSSVLYIKNTEAKKVFIEKVDSKALLVKFKRGNFFQ